MEMKVFLNIIEKPHAVCAGLIAKCVCIPFMGWALVKTFEIDVAYGIAFQCLTICPGGLNSNLYSFLSMSDTPMSVAMTTVSTLGK